MLRQNQRAGLAAHPAQHTELIPPQTGTDGAIVQGCDQSLSDLSQHRIACGMAKVVVEILELVQIDVHQRQGAAAALRLLETLFEFQIEGATVV